MSEHRYQIVDVFCQGAFSGNPVAVVRAPGDLSTEAMQRITRWFNLSETAFLLPPTDPAADYRVRIFTLDREMPFAGHPTLGTCHAWLHDGGTPADAGVVIQQCGAGLVRVARGAEGLAFAAPPLIRGGPVEEDKLAEVAAVLRIAREEIVDAQWADNGPGWVAVRLADADAVRALAPARFHGARIDVGVVGLYPAESRFAYEVRAFFSDPFGGIVEDPVTGSLNASLAGWLVGTGAVSPPYLAAQGGNIGRDGLVRITRDDAGALWIGGDTVTRAAGLLEV